MSNSNLMDFAVIRVSADGDIDSHSITWPRAAHTERLKVSIPDCVDREWVAEQLHRLAIMIEAGQIANKVPPSQDCNADEFLRLYISTRLQTLIDEHLKLDGRSGTWTKPTGLKSQEVFVRGSGRGSGSAGKQHNNANRTRQDRRSGQPEG